jgi:GNAT superfamily N-acetyltransferase
MKLDRYVYDSQFLFLNEEERLIELFKRNVLKDTKQIYFGELIGFARHEKWDSDKMGKYIGRLVWLEDKINSAATFKETLSELNEYDCCYVRLNAEHSFCQFSETGGLKVLSSKISQHLTLNGYIPKFNNANNYFEFSNETKNSRDIILQVLAISERSFNHSRFRADKNFSKEVADEIYRSWVINEIKNETSKLYFTMNGNRVASFFLYGENISPLKEYKIGFVSLIASSPEFKGKQYASNLMNFVLHKAKITGTNYVIANTEAGNVGALGFFKSNGFVQTSHLKEYHIWN